MANMLTSVSKPNIYLFFLEPPRTQDNKIEADPLFYSPMALAVGGRGHS